MRPWFVLGLLVLAVGCGSGGDGSDGSAAGEDAGVRGTESAVEGAGAPADGAAVGEGGPADGPGSAPERGDTVLVVMDEYVIDMPLTLPAGHVAFRVRNAGFEEHNFELLQGDSLLLSFENPLNPAQTRTLEITLEPGRYDVLCTVSGHEGRGMQEVLTVTAQGEGTEPR